MTIIRNKRFYRRSTLALGLVVFGLLSLTTFVHAYMKQTYQSLSFDKSIALTQEASPKVPDHVYVFRIRTYADELKSSPKRWVHNLYYYMITQMNFPDIPFNYAIAYDGEIYELREDAAINLSQVGSADSLYIGLLLDDRLTGEQRQAVSELLAELNNDYGIEKDDVEFVDIEFQPMSVESQEGAQVPTRYTINMVTPTDGFIEAMQSAMGTVEFRQPDLTTYKLRVENVKSEPDTVSLGEKVHVTFDLLNVGDKPIVIRNDQLFVKTADGEDSPFAVSGQWPSLDTPVSFESTIIKPHEHVSAEFDLFASTLPGEHTVDFVIEDATGHKFEDTRFAVDFTIDKGDAKISQIKETETGVLNVRKEPSLNSEKVTQVGVGERFVWTEKDGAWYKIKYSETGEGWVYARYVQVL